jgi:hypothetical protein
MTRRLLTCAACVASAALFRCGPTEMPRVANEQDIERLFTPEPMVTPPPPPLGLGGWDDPRQRAELYALLDAGQDVHNACIFAENAGDDAVPHLIRAVRQFGDKEPGLGEGFECTWAHCVEALQKITDARPGYTAKTWQRWYERRRAALNR